MLFESPWIAFRFVQETEKAVDAKPSLARPLCQTGPVEDVPEVFEPFFFQASFDLVFLNQFTVTEDLSLVRGEDGPILSNRFSNPDSSLRRGAAGDGLSRRHEFPSSGRGDPCPFSHQPVGNEFPSCDGDQIFDAIPFPVINENESPADGPVVPLLFGLKERANPGIGPDESGLLNPGIILDASSIRRSTSWGDTSKSSTSSTRIEVVPRMETISFGTMMSPLDEGRQRLMTRWLNLWLVMSRDPFERARPMRIPARRRN